jgi:hypothetical protein
MNEDYDTLKRRAIEAFAVSKEARRHKLDLSPGKLEHAFNCLEKELNRIAFENSKTHTEFLLIKYELLKDTYNKLGTI